MSTETLDPDEARQRLYEIMRSDAPFAQKAEQTLELGKAYLGVDHAHLTRIDPQTDYWKAISSTDPEGGRFPTGLTADLQNTYCRRTIQHDGSLALHDAPAQGWADDPAFDTHELHCYHGTPLTINDDTYGTVCFVSESPREPFTDGDTMFAELIARMLEHEIQRSHHEAELTRRSNLVNVLNRILRHNLRNGMAVIRGRAEMIADQYDTTEPQDIIDRSDQLIELSEKARKLESVIVNEGEYQDTDLQTLLTQVTEQVAKKYPSASITVDAPEPVTAAARPGLRMALQELVENAAEHAGADPTITVSAKTRSNEVEITIRDDGPGLNTIEQEVLTDGVETPLVHGMGLGLWLVYWIVTSHEGAIEATASEDGTVMKIRLPQNVQSTVSTGDTQRERTLDRVQDTFRAVFDEAFDAMVIADDDDHIIDANQSAADLFGVPARDLRGRQLAEFMKDEATADSIWHSSNDTTQGRETVPIVRTDGTEAILEYTTTANIVPGHHLAIMRDVTSHRDREQQLEVAETIFQNTQDALFLIDVTDQEEFRIQRVNDTYRDLTGLSNDDIRGLTPQETVGEAVGTDIEARYRECVKRGETIEYSEEIPVDGETRYWQTKLTPIHHDGTVSKLVGAMRDITERVARQRALERYETVLETIEDAAWILDRKKQLTFVNRALVEKLSITTEQAEGAPLAAFQEFFSDPGTFETYETLVDDMLAGVAEEGDLDVTLDLPQGEQDVNVRVVPLLGDDGPTGVVGIARDITGRKEHERELAVKTRAIEEAPIGITMTDASRPDNPLVYANKAFEQLTGYAAEEIRGRNCRFLQGERTDPDTVATIRDAIDAEQPVSVDVRNYRSDGTEFWNHLTVAPVTNNTGDVIRYVGFQQDITGRREQEREFSQLEYVLEAVLSTASGILWTTDEEGIITRARGAALAHFGVKPDEVVGNAVDDVFNAQSSVGEHTARALDGERVTATLTIGDATFDVWYGPLNADDGDLVGTVGFAALTNRNRSSQSHD